MNSATGQQISDAFSWGNLIPNFPALADWRSSADGLTAAFVLFILVIFAYFLVLAGIKWLAARRHIRFYEKLLQDINANNLAQNREELKQRAKKMEAYAGLWQEFDETLVCYEVPGGSRRLCNTYDAEQFFNAATLSHGLSGNRLLAAVPAFLTAVGVIGTFVGLTLGMEALKLNQSTGNSAELSQGIRDMISGAAMAFLTSVWGVISSLLFNFIEKLMERSVIRLITRLQNRIDFLFPRFSPDECLIKIAESNAVSQQTLQGLAEQIGNRFQETLNNIMGPTMNALTSEMGSLIAGQSEQSKQIHENLAGLLQQFSEAASGSAAAGQGLQQSSEQMQAASTELGKMARAMQNAMETLETSVGSAAAQTADVAVKNHEASENLQSYLNSYQQLAGQFDTIAANLDAATARANSFIATVAPLVDKSEQMNRQLADLLLKFGSVAVPLDSAGKNLAASSRQMLDGATQLGQMSAALQTAIDKLSGDIGRAADITAGLSEQNSRTSNTLKESLASYQNLTKEIEPVFATLKEATEHAERGLTSVCDNLQQCGDTIKRNVADLDIQLRKTLEAHIQTVDEQVGRLLTGYAEQVQNQTSARLEQWNQQTANYTDSMTRAVQALNGVVDEIEGKVGARA